MADGSNPIAQGIAEGIEAMQPMLTRNAASENAATRPSAVMPAVDFDPNMISPGGIIDHSRGTPAQGYQPVPPQPSAEQHIGWLGRILDTVGSILGGDQTIRITKAPDGTLSMEQDPSTRGEKWSRIASAALGGAAQGLANSQGPAGLANAAAAGTQYGLKLPQQQRQDLQQQVDFGNRQLLAKANRIHLTQETYMLAQQAKLADLQFNQQSANTLSNYLGLLRSSPNAQDLGPIDPSDPNAAMNTARKNPGAMDAFLGKSNQVLRPVIAPDHKLHMILTDRTWEESRNTTQMERLYVGKNDKGEPTLLSEPVPVGGGLNGEILNHNLAVMKQFYPNLKDYATATKDIAAAEREPTERNQSFEQAAAAAFNAAANEPDPQKKAALIAKGNELYQKARGLRASTHVSVAPASPDTIANWGRNLADPSTGATLANVPRGDRGAVINWLAQNGQKMAHPLTARELDRADLANNAISNIEEAQRILTKRPDLFGPVQGRLTKLRQAIQGGDPDAAAYQTAINLANLPAVGIHGVRGKYALMDIANLDADLYRNPEAMAMILSEIHRSASEFGHLGGRQTDAGGAAPPTGPAAAPAAGGAQPQNVAPPGVPPGGTPGRDKSGKVVGYTDKQGSWHPF